MTHFDEQKERHNLQSPHKGKLTPVHCTFTIVEFQYAPPKWIGFIPDKAKRHKRWKILLQYQRIVFRYFLPRHVFICHSIRLHKYVCDIKYMFMRHIIFTTTWKPYCHDIITEVSKPSSCFNAHVCFTCHLHIIYQCGCILSTRLHSSISSWGHYFLQLYAPNV